MAAIGTMYSVKPHYDVNSSVTVSDVMYPVKRLIPSVPGLQEPQSLEQRQISLLEKLDSLIAITSERLGGGASSNSAPTGSVLNEICQSDCPLDVVIRANPSQPPLWLKLVKKQLEDTGVLTWWKFHTHSSVTSSPMSFPTRVRHENRHQYKLIVTVIWCHEGQCPSLHISPSTRTAIHGESNIFRFFARILGVYDTQSSIGDAIIDLCLDACDVIISPSSTNQEKASTLKSITMAIDKGTWFSQNSLPLMEACLASILNNYGIKNIPQEALKKWAMENASRLSA